VADPARRDAQLGDLAEEHAARAERDARAADRWYRKQVLGSLAPNVALRLSRAGRGRQRRMGDATMSVIAQDFRLALRGVRRNPGFSSVIVGTLALGIGATTTTFSVVYGLVLDPFPFPEPDRIVGVGSAYPRLGADLGFFENLSPHEYLDIRDNARTLEQVVAWDMGNRQIDTDGPAENVFSAFWWGDVLTTLGMDPHLGRGFSADEIRTGASAVMLSHAIWTRRFGADSSMVGGSISVNGTPYDLVGIVPEGVDIYGTDLWMIMPVQPEAFPRNRRQFQVMGRIGEGSSLQEVNAELAGIASRVERSYGAELEEYEGWYMRALTWSEVSSRVFRTGVLILLGAVGFVLLLVCANTANLLLARAPGRAREMAVRTALGAGRGRLLLQLLTESVTLALVGGTLGVALATIGVAAVRRFVEAMGLNLAGTIELDAPVLAFTAAVALGAGVVFGLAPALYASAGALPGTLQSEARGATAGVSRQRLQRTLVGLEVALAFVLLAAGGLLLHSFIRVNRVEPGFEPAGVLTMRLTLPREEYGEAEGPAFFRELVERVGALPGVRGAAAGTQFPSTAFAFREVYFDGPAPDPEATLPTTLTTVVTPGYFETLRIPLVAGRTFNDQDAAGTPLVALVNSEAARRYFSGRNPVGSRLKLGSADAEGPWWEIVGVVGTTRNLGLDQEPFPEVFAAHEQVGGLQNQLFVLIRAEGVEPESLAPAVRRTVQEMDADQPVYGVRTVAQAYRQGVAPMRATTLFLAAFAAFALALAAVGIYAVVSFTVSQRTPEIGLRVALGADAGRIRRLVVRQALVPVGVGAAAGLLASLALGRGIERMLYQVSGRDPLTLGAVATGLVAVALLASWVPAWRASRMDPVEALRAE
jgi:putative ABC transport system permease protein